MQTVREPDSDLLPDLPDGGPETGLATLIAWLAEHQEGLSAEQSRALCDRLAAILADMQRRRRGESAAVRAGEANDEAPGSAQDGRRSHGTAATDDGSGEDWSRACARAERLEQMAMEDAVAEVYALFVQYFGGFDRQLSGNEAEQLRVWLKECPPALVHLAIQRAVARERISLGYVDRILYNWSRQGLTTVEQAREREAAFQERRRQGRGGDGHGGPAGGSASGRLGQHPGREGRSYDDEELW